MNGTIPTNHIHSPLFTHSLQESDYRVFLQTAQDMLKMHKSSGNRSNQNHNSRISQLEGVIETITRNQKSQRSEGLNEVAEMTKREYVSIDFATSYQSLIVILDI